MFGYWAAVWVRSNRWLPFPDNNPFIDLFKMARRKLKS